MRYYSKSEDNQVKLYGLVNLALARDPISRELWYIVTTNWPRYKRSATTANALILKRNFWMKSPMASNWTSLMLINRPVPCVWFGNRNILLTAQDNKSSRNSLRRFVDCHWYRGNSYLRLGWGVEYYIVDGGYSEPLPFRRDWPGTSARLFQICAKIPWTRVSGQNFSYAFVVLSVNQGKNLSYPH